MISSKDIEDYSYLVSARFEAINTHYLKLMGKQINEIGRLSPSNLHRLQQMAIYNQNIEEINNLLAQETNRTLEELYQVYDMSGFSVYGDYSDMYKANGKIQVPFTENMAIQGYLNSVKSLTQGTFMNMANTTVASHSNYQKLVDTAIDAIATGQTDYNRAIRQQMVAIADEGLTVTYASGYKRRLDSAVRMNILEGVRKVNEGVRQVSGEQFGADGYEISAHALCAADHIDIQGKQYSKKDFGKLNDELQRKIGTCNCKHTIFPIILGISKPAYTDSELKQYKDNSQQQVTLTMGYNADGTPRTKTMTKYEATQVQRNLETEIRRAKDRHIISENAGDTVGTKQAKDRILTLRKNYKKISAEAGLTPKWDRTFVAGYTGKQTTPKPITLSYNTQTAKKSIKTQTNNIVNGKDITNTWKRREDKFDFEIEDVINAQGFDGLPRVVGAGEFDKYVKESNFIAQRTYSAPSQEILKGYQDQLYNGKWYVDCSTGGAAHGKGMYAFSQNQTKVSSWMEGKIEGYGGKQDNAIVETFTIDKSAKFINEKDLFEISNKFANDSIKNIIESEFTGIEKDFLYVQQGIKTFDDVDFMKISTELSKEKRQELLNTFNNKMGSVLNVTSDNGAIATLFGYDGIISNQGEGDIVVILNRTKVIFKKGD